MGVAEAADSSGDRGMLQVLLDTGEVLKIAEDLWEPFEHGLKKGPIKVNIKKKIDEIINIQQGN